MDAANIDLKAFTDRFYHKLCGGRLQPVLDTLEYLKNETTTWFELTTLLIPGENDSEAEIEQMTQWIMEHLGSSVPLHFTAFHPDWKMTDKPKTTLASVQRARSIALNNGLRYVYTGNVHDVVGSSTYCHHCGEVLIGRDWYELSNWSLVMDGARAACRCCNATLAGVFEAEAGCWGSRRHGLEIGE
jgi:pyruvate formate lyase activating enzyme